MLAAADCVSKLIYLINVDLSWSFEQLAGLTGPPTLEPWIKIEAGEMTQDTCHDNGAISPLSKVEVKLVVLHILIAADVSLSWLVLPRS